jgi:hypothetical protein
MQLGTDVCSSSASNNSPPRPSGRAHAEINEFEEQLTDHGIVIVKYWTSRATNRSGASRTSVDAGQELEAERRTGGIAPSGADELAVNDMVSRTSTRNAPASSRPTTRTTPG